jgi:hypothetical protein
MSTSARERKAPTAFRFSLRHFLRKKYTSLSAQAPTAIKQQGTHLSLLVCENKAVELEDVGLDFTWVASMSIEQQARQVLHTDRQTNGQKQN